MDSEGPLLEALTRRLADCPQEFLLEPRVGDGGVIDMAALVCDHFRAMGLPPPVPDDLLYGVAFDSIALSRLRLIGVATGSCTIRGFWRARIWRPG
jgi:hypothetical protein